MIQNFLRIFLLLIIGLQLQGCINYTQKVSLNRDGSGTIEVHYWMDIPESDSTGLLPDSVGIFDSTKIREVFTADYTTVQSITVYRDSTDSTLHAQIIMDFQHLDSLNALVPFQGYEFSFKEGAAGQSVVSQKIPPLPIAQGAEPTKFIATFIYDLHGEMITHNAQKIDGTKLSWRYFADEIGQGKNIAITYKPYKIKETPQWIYGLMVFTLLVVIYFLFRKKK